MPKLRKHEGELRLTLTGATDFQAALAAAKAVPGRRYNADTKEWCFPEDPLVAERLMVTVKPEVSVEVLSWVKLAKADKAQELVTKLPDDADLLLPWDKQRVPWQPETVGPKGEEVPFKGLFPFQRSFVHHAAAQEKPRIILADDMGTGKCGQSSSAIMEFMLSKSGYVGNLDMPIEHFKNAADMIAWAGVTDGPKLVIAPNSVKGTWARELRMWLGQDIPHVIVDGSTAKKRNQQILEGIAQNAWVIVNWEQIRTKKAKVKKRVKVVHPFSREFIKWAEKEVEAEVMREPFFETTPWVAVIADEAHRAKNRKSYSTKGLWRIDGEAKLALTGTPLMNSPDELWPLLHWLYPEEYTSFWRFFDQYVDYYEGQYGKIITGVKNPDALKFELTTRLVRRTKKEVLKDLPDKTREIVPITLGPKQRKLYTEAEKQMWFEVEQAIKEGDKNAEQFAKRVLENPNAIYTVPNGAARTVRLRQVASTPALLGGEDESAKLDAAQEIILDAQPKQFVVFTEFVETANIFAERLRAKGLKVGVWTGEVETADRTQLENDFQQGEIDVIVGTIQAMKEGVTLTASDTAIFIERHWTPATNEQAEDRLHRSGQRNNVTILILQAEDTVDTQKIHPINQFKSLIVSSVIKKDDVEEVTR